MSRRVPLSRGYEAIVDDADFDAVIAAGPWYARPDGTKVYAQRSLPRTNGRRPTLLLHKFLTGWALVDHQNGDGLDNRRENLRPATASQNKANMDARRDNTSGFKGVSWHPCGRWRAHIKVDGRNHHLGLFDFAEDAAKAYDAAAFAAWGEFARLNFPEEARHG